jgi:hypothetical protein
VKKIIAGVTFAALVLVVGCSPSSESQKQGQKETEEAFNQQSKAVPYPKDQLKDSQERRNIRDRLLRTNNPNAISYLYVLSFSKPLGYYTVKGKVTSTQSQMTTEQIWAKPCDGCDGTFIPGPGDDGSYGANEPGIFFFTTEGVMVTTNLDYIISDQPIAVGEFIVPKLNK